MKSGHGGMTEADFAFVEELRLMGYGESDSAGMWIKLQVTDEVLEQVRGRKGELIEVAARWVNGTGERGGRLPPEPPPTPTQKGPHGKYVSQLHACGFFTSPDVWAALGSDAGFLAWVRRQPSALSGLYSGYENGEGRCVAAHVRRIDSGAGVGIKPPYSAIPLTDAEHRRQHDKGESALAPREWWDEQRIKHVARWAHMRARQIFSVESLTHVSPDQWLAWARQNGVERYLPRMVVDG